MTAAPARAASTAAAAISSGVTGRCGDMVGVWIPPVGAQVMMTDLCTSGPRSRECGSAVGPLARGDADEGAIGVEHEAVEVVDAVLGQSRARRVVDDAPLVERRSPHPALHALDEADVLLLQHLVDVADRLVLGLVELGRLEEEIPCLVR